MIVIYMLLSFAIVVGALALFWRLAARILRYNGVTWPMAFLVAATIVSAIGFIRGVLTALGFGAPMPVAIALGPTVPIALGAWCFHDRATRPDGEPLNWSGAFKLSGLAFALYAVSALLLVAVLMTMLPRDA